MRILSCICSVHIFLLQWTYQAILVRLFVYAVKAIKGVFSCSRVKYYLNDIRFYCQQVKCTRSAILWKFLHRKAWIMPLFYIDALITKNIYFEVRDVHSWTFLPRSKQTCSPALLTFIDLLLCYSKLIIVAPILSWSWIFCHILFEPYQIIHPIFRGRYQMPRMLILNLSNLTFGFVHVSLYWYIEATNRLTLSLSLCFYRTSMYGVEHHASVFISKFQVSQVNCNRQSETHTLRPLSHHLKLLCLLHWKFIRE